MIGGFLHSKYQYITEFFERFTTSKNWKLKVTLLGLCLSLFFAFPSYNGYVKGAFDEKWNAVSQQIKAPFTPVAYPDDSHYSKLAFRLTVPIIAHILHFQRIGCFLIQYICWIVMFYAILSLTYSIVKDKITSSFIILALSFMFVGNVMVSDIRAIFDGVAFCFLMLTMLSWNWVFIIICALLAYYTDERALIASTFLFVWFQVRQSDFKAFALRNILIPSKSSIALVASWGIYFGIRYYLSLFLGLKTGTGGANYFTHQFNNMLFGAWSGLEGFWIIVLLGFIVLFIRKMFSLAIIITLCMAISLYVAFSVIDITRSVAYIFPVVFICLYIIKAHENVTSLRKYAFITFLVCCFFPTYYTDGVGTLWFFFPLPWRLMGLFTHLR